MNTRWIIIHICSSPEAHLCSAHRSLDVGVGKYFRLVIQPDLIDLSTLKLNIIGCTKISAAIKHTKNG